MSDEDLIKLYRTFFVLGDQTCLKILFELAGHGERSFSELRDRLHINPATLSKKLKLLSGFDLVVADRSHDRLRVFYAMHNHQRSTRRILSEMEKLSQEL